MKSIDELEYIIYSINCSLFACLGLCYVQSLPGDIWHGEGWLDAQMN